MIALFEMDTKPIICSVIEDELELLKAQNIDEVQTLGEIEFEKEYCEYMVYMIGQCMCSNYFPAQYLADVTNYINGLNNP